jgi:16S rRNA (guanine527-N7)-methyltransferase
MTEQEAQAALDVPRETLAGLECLLNLIREENGRQNLVSATSLVHAWSRHILDSAQLLRFAPKQEGRWLDLGSGAGFPGLVLALLRRSKVTLVEERRLRAAFLEQAAERLGIADRVEVLCTRAETAPARPFDMITARAFAPLGRLLALGERFSTAATVWILPKGRSAKSELDAARSSWQGEFRLEPSLTDPDARIIVASNVRRRARGKSAR